MDKLMKGHTFAKGKKKLTYPASAEVKVDEIRCDVRLTDKGVQFRSYADKPLANLEEWGGVFADFMRAFDVTRLDMGVIVNRSFNDTYRWVRSTKGVPADLTGAKVEFILFDLPDLTEEPYIDRIQQRRRLCNIMGDYDLPVFVPRRVVVHDENDVMDLYASVRDGGDEGLMVKDHGHLYEAGKRTNGWLKVKPEEDADGIVTGWTEAVSEEGVELGRAGSLLVVCEDGSRANVPGIAHDLGREIAENFEAFRGRWLEFQYMERDRQGGYRHPRFNRFREDKQ